MSRKYNVENRLQKAYQRYLEEYRTRSQKWVKRGHKLADPMEMSYNDYVMNRDLQKSLGVAPGNVNRVLVSNQLYEYSQETAKNILEQLNELNLNDKMGKISIRGLRGGLAGKALSLINEELKKDPNFSSGYDRAQYIKEHVYPDSL